MKLSVRLRRLWPLYFLLPAIAAFLLMSAYPVGTAIYLSFVEWNGYNPRIDFAGLQNYVDLLGGDPRVAALAANALRNTAFLAVVVPVVVVVLSFLLANAVFAASRRVAAVLRTVFFIPYVTAGIAVFYAWRFLFLPSGGVNGLLESIGLGALAQPDGFLADAGTALPAIALVMIWLLTPLGMLVYLTALQGVDRTILEAADVDGAGGTQKLLLIVWPLLLPTTALIVIICLREALQDFQAVLLMTNGGPLGSTTTLSFLAYEFAFGPMPAYGLASALGWLLFIAGVAISGLVFWIARRAARNESGRRS